MGELIAVDSITVSPISDIVTTLEFYLYTDDEISYGTALFKGSLNNWINNSWYLNSSNSTYTLSYVNSDWSTQTWSQTENGENIDLSSVDNLKTFLYKTTVTVYSDNTFSVTKTTESSSYKVSASFSAKVAKLESNELTNVITEDAATGLHIKSYLNGDSTSEGRTVQSEIILGDGEINIGIPGEDTYSTFASDYVQFGNYRLEKDATFNKDTNTIGETAAGLMFRFYDSVD